MRALCFRALLALRADERLDDGAFAFRVLRADVLDKFLRFANLTICDAFDESLRTMIPIVARPVGRLVDPQLQIDR